MTEARVHVRPFNDRATVFVALAAALLSACSGDRTVGITPGSAPMSLAERPNAPVIFLHYDYMADSPRGVKFVPDPAAMDRVVAAFRRHGVQLVIDPKHTVLPYHPLLALGPCVRAFLQFDCVNLYDLKAQYFTQSGRGRQDVHYAVFGDMGGCFSDDGAPVLGVGGCAEVPGLNFIVTQFGGDAPCPINERGADPCNTVVGTFMHELGHNLDLRHGGADGENWKPNYISLMNYSFQNIGIPITSAPGQTGLEDIVEFRFDYSDLELPTLDETHLDERVGLGGPTTGTALSYAYVCPEGTGCGYDLFTFAHEAAGPVDWNQNGVIEADVRVDVNVLWTIEMCHCGVPEFGRLPGFDDWSHVQAFLRTPAYVMGKVHPLRTEP